MEARGQPENHGGIIRDPEVTSKGKLNDRKKKKVSEKVLAPWECSARSYTGFTNVCTCAQVLSNGWARARVKWHRIRKRTNTHRRVRVISRRIPHVHTHTPKPSSISGFRAPPRRPRPTSPPLCFWLCLHAGRRSPDTHRWVSPLHINAAYSPIRSPICAFLLPPPHPSCFKIKSLV